MPLPEPTAQEAWDAVAAETAADKTPTPLAVLEEDIPAAKTDPAPEVVAAPAVVDPYAGFDEATQAKLRKFDEMSTLFPAMAQTLKETQGRVSAMQSEFAKGRQATPADAAPTQKQVAQATADPEKWASLKKDFPEWGEGIEAFVAARVDALAGSGLTAEQIEAQIATKVGAGVEKVAADFQQELVAYKYPTWVADVKTPAFEAWFPKQTAEVQALATSPKGRDALQMLDLFHEAQKTPAVRQSRKQLLEAAVTATKGATATVPKTFADLNPTEQWNYMAEERARKAAAQA